MLISELSRHTGLSIDTIRFYQKVGLVKGQRKAGVQSNNYLHYCEADIEKLELIQDAKSVGFTLAEIGQLLDAWYNKRFNKTKKLALLDEKLSAIDQKIAHLKEIKKLIADFKKSVAEDAC